MPPPSTTKALVIPPETQLSTAVLQDRIVKILEDSSRNLSIAVTIPQHKLIADIAAAQEIFSIRQRLSEDVIVQAHTLKIVALAKLGELLEQTPKATGTRGTFKGSRKGTSGGTPSEPPDQTVPTLAEMGIGKKTAHLARKLSALSDTDLAAVAERQKTLAQIQAIKIREQRVELVQALSVPPDLETLEPVPVLYADPPWRYEHVKTESRAIENQYPSMSLDEICALDAGAASTADAVLFLWATSPKLAEAMQVISAWGFTYRTSMVWVKDKIGMGYYVRQQHELLLIATKGSLPTPLPSNRPSSLVVAPRLGHSEKPDKVYALIEAMYPEFKKRELFMRGGERQGWLNWGNECTTQ